MAQENKHFVIKLMTLSILKFRAIRQHRALRLCLVMTSHSHTHIALRAGKDFWGWGRLRVGRFVCLLSIDLELPVVIGFVLLLRFFENTIYLQLVYYLDLKNTLLKF